MIQDIFQKQILQSYQYSELFQAEKQLTFIRLTELQNMPIEGDFNFEHLKSIHKYIFQDLYEWALIFEFFGSFSDEEIYQRYCNNQFVPCTFQNWQLDKRSYQVACKAVSWNRTNRYRTFEEFFHEWKSATEIS